MPWLFLAVSVYGAWFTVNAFRPSSRWQLLGASFFAAWLTGELAVWHIVWQAVATVGFIALGALDAWPGWLGLAITLASWAGLVVLSAVSRRSGLVFDHALTEGIGLDAPDHARSAHWRQAVFPFLLRDRRVERVKNLEYGPFGRRNLLDVYRPRTRESRSSLAPVLFQIHGGAWVIGDKSQQGLPLMLHLASEGWVCVAINYRLSPRATWPEHLIDCKRALAWVREHIAEYGGDPDLICVTGGSAGGHLAAMTALTANEPEYQPGFESAETSVAACVPFYGVYDFSAIFDGTRASDRGARLLARWVMKATPESDHAAFERASPVNHLRTDAPPFFVIHGTHDNLAPVGQARTFVERLRAVSHEPVLYAEVPGASHAFDVFYSTRTGNAVSAVDRFLAWIVDREQPGTPDRAPEDVGLAGALEPTPAAPTARVEAGRAPAPGTSSGE
ncbi:MAG: alpha/beta hydrolase fold domain-containing protein [Acidimicrobiia bacterium]